MAKKQTNADQLITTILAGIEDVKGKNINILDKKRFFKLNSAFFIFRLLQKNN